MRQRWFGPHVLPRLPPLMLGLVLLGSAIALLARSELGLNPWEVLHQGISRQTGLPMGTVSIVLGVPILLLWLPLRERPGLGTLLELSVVPVASGVTQAVAYLVVGIGGYAIATGVYLATNLGPGPRDGLMTGIHHRFGWRISYVRTGLEVIALVTGFLNGWHGGHRDVVFALGIGTLTELSLGVFDREGHVTQRRIARGAEPIPAEGAE